MPAMRSLWGASSAPAHHQGFGAMFGFEELAAFTHNLETAFDEVRNGRLDITSELIDLTLQALDRIRAMLEEGMMALRRPTRLPAPGFSAN